MHEPLRTLQTPAGEVRVFADPERAALAAADHITGRMRAAHAERGTAVLGLATGATPVTVYENLVTLHRKGAVTFKDTTTYNLDEYYPISPLAPQSYRRYMHEHLFAHVDIRPNRAHLLDGSVPSDFVAEHCDQYERWIASDGGIDLQLLGVGRNGHIGFNEPSDLGMNAALALRTRLVSLHPTTRAAAAREFGALERVPEHALTLGVATILEARSILVLAFGAAKSRAAAEALFEPPTPAIPASLLQTVRSRVVWIVDEAALGERGYRV